jgi:hypothetical protein
VFSHPNAVPEPIGLDFEVGVGSGAFDSPAESGAFAASPGLDGDVSAPLGVVAEEEGFLVALAIVFPGRRIFIVLCV